uniref:Uncharacterized protein n=1 Tax=Panagrolaimus superbus TaxID=310955 RepID=A0A914Y542_9BILA
MGMRSSKGFKFTGHIDKYLLIKNGTLFTEESIVDGMPDVKWSLKFNVNSSETDQTGMYLEINTAENVDWIVNFDFGSFARQNTQGSSKGLRKILFYEFTANDLFNSCFLKSYEKIPYTIDAAFSNQSSQKFNTPIICNPVEWGLRLQQNSAEDFEFLVDGETFPVCKFHVLL